MGIFNRVNKGFELGKTLSSYGYQKAKTLTDPELIKLTNDLTMKWIRIGGRKADETLDKAIELTKFKLEESKSGTDRISQIKNERKVQLKNAVDRADLILNENNPGSIDAEYELKKKQIKELEDLKNKQARELEELKKSN